MRFLFAKNREDALSNNNQQLVILLLCSGIVNIILVGLLTWTIMHKKIIIIPAVLNAPVAVSDVDVDASMVDQMAVFLTYLRFNVDPANVVFQHDFIEQFVDSSTRGAITSILNKEEDQIQQNKISSTFSVQSVAANPGDLEARVTGILNETVGSLALKPQEKTYLLTFTYNYGRLLIKEFSEVKDNVQAQ